MIFRHMSNLTSHAKSVTRNVHAVMIEHNEALCGLISINKIVDGIEVQLMYDVPRPVNCTACTKALEMAMRRELATLDASGLEAVAELVQKLRLENGN